MPVLCVCLGLVAPGLTGIVFFAVAAADDFSRSGKGFFGNTKRVRSHIGDETHGAFFSQLDAFIELRASIIVRFGVRFSFLDASCCRLEVINSGAGFFRRWVFLTLPTVKGFPAICERT